MNLITRNNYEAYLLDYIEENLSPELIAELMLFLEKNPDLKDELDGYEGIKLIAPTVCLENKDEIKKDESLITLTNCEDFIIQEIEGENTAEISAALHLFLEKNPDKQADFLAYQKTKLIASTIIFSDKKSLKKKEGIIIPMYWWYSSAAAIIIIFLLNGFNNGEKNKVQPIADNVEIITPIKNDQNIKEEKIEEIKEENKLASGNVKKAFNTSIEKKEVKEKVPPINPEIKDESPKMLAENPVEAENNTVDSLPSNNVTEEVVEEIQYADNVKITFDDDEPVTKAKEPDSKFKTVGQTLTKRFLKQDKDENGEVVAYAVNVGDFSFSRNKRKR